MADTPSKLPSFVAWPSFPFEGQLRTKRLEGPVPIEPAREGEDPSECTACKTPDDTYIWVSDRWRVRAMDRPSGLPMVLVLESRSHLDLGDLPNLLAAELGVMTVRLERAVRSLDGVERVHVNRWGDNAAHLHLWFLARPTGYLQLRGSFLSMWDDILEPVAEDIWRENLALVAAWLADFGGRAIAEPPRIEWHAPSHFGEVVAEAAARFGDADASASAGAASHTPTSTAPSTASAVSRASGTPASSGLFPAVSGRDAGPLGTAAVPNATPSVETSTVGAAAKAGGVPTMPSPAVTGGSIPAGTLGAATAGATTAGTATAGTPARAAGPSDATPPAQRTPPQGLPGQGLPGQGLPGQGLPGQGLPGQGVPAPAVPLQTIRSGNVPAGPAIPPASAIPASTTATGTPSAPRPADASSASPQTAGGSREPKAFNANGRLQQRGSGDSDALGGDGWDLSSDDVAASDILSH